MSLISEGLKKAHLDAMRQDREQRKAYLRSARPHVPNRAVSHVPQMLAIGLGSAVVAAAAMFWLRGMNAAPPSHPAIRAAAGSTSTSTATPGTPIQPAKPVVVVAKAAAPAEQKTRAPEKAVATPGRAVAEKENALPQKQEPPPVRRRDGFVDGETYGSPINGPGGMEVTLTGILGVADEAVAIINGRSVRSGVMIGPFVVEKVERQRVQLRYIDVHFYLTP